MGVEELLHRHADWAGGERTGEVCAILAQWWHCDARRHLHRAEERGREWELHRPWPSSHKYTGEQGPCGAAVPLPRLAGGRDSLRRKRDDQHHRCCSETAATKWQPPHYCALQRWSWPHRDILRSQHGPGAGQSRGDPGCVSDSEKPPTAETSHGADTGAVWVLLQSGAGIHWRLLRLCQLQIVLHNYFKNASTVTSSPAPQRRSWTFQTLQTSFEPRLWSGSFLYQDQTQDLNRSKIQTKAWPGLSCGWNDTLVEVCCVNTCTPQNTQYQFYFKCIIFFIPGFYFFKVSADDLTFSDESLNSYSITFCY